MIDDEIQFTVQQQFIIQSFYEDNSKKSESSLRTPRIPESVPEQINQDIIDFEFQEKLCDDSEHVNTDFFARMIAEICQESMREERAHQQSKQVFE